MNVACQYCGNRWFLTAETLELAMEAAPQKGRSVGVECPRCRKMVKVARPKRPRPGPPPVEEAEAAEQDE